MGLVTVSADHRMDDALFFDSDVVERTAIRDDGQSTAQANILDQVTDTIRAATLLVGRQGQTE